MKEIRTAAIVGMGALGMLYATQIEDSLGPDAVCFVAGPDRLEKYQNMTFTVNGKPRHFVLKDARRCEPADLVIVAVKYNTLASALDTMARCVGPDTVIISVLNGISSEEIIGERYGMDKVVYCVAQGMDAVKFGGDLTYTKPGELRIGISAAQRDGGGTQAEVQKEDQADSPAGTYSEVQSSQERLGHLVDFLTRARVPHKVEADILYRLWGKFMLNVGINQVCMAFETNYGGALVPGRPFDTMVGAMREVVTLANREGIALSESDIDSYIALLRTLSPEGMPSMRQDGIAHRPSEVEMFSGTVRALAKNHGLEVPVNDWLYERIHQMEAAY